MEADTREALAAVCLMAAFADGQKDDAERTHLKQVYDSLDLPNAPALYQKVLLRQTSLADEAQALIDPATRTLAYEMAVGVCDADGQTTADERAFLERLRSALDLDAGHATAVLHQAEALADAPVTAPATASAASAAGSAAPTADDAELDGTILRYATLNGALELLPESLSTMAIIPLQMKLVYSVGQHYGYDLDRGHLKDFLATVGVGMTSQVVEGYARTLLGGFLKKSMGRAAGTMGKAATSSALSFATTYALGQAARTYYRQGRNISMDDLKAQFQTYVEDGKQLFDQHEGAVRQRADTINPTDLLSMVRRA